MLDIADAAGDEIIDLIYAEELDEDAVPPARPRAQTACEEAHGRPIPLPARAQRWETFGFERHALRAP